MGGRGKRNTLRLCLVAILLFIMAAGTFYLCTQVKDPGRRWGKLSGKQAVPGDEAQWMREPADTKIDRVYFLYGNGLEKRWNGELSLMQSDCAVVRSNGRWGLIDVGMASDKGIRSRLSAQLARLAKENGGGINLDFIVITHSHLDHGGYFDGLFRDNPNITMSDQCKIYLKSYEDNDPSYSNPQAEPLYNNARIYKGIMDTLWERYGENVEEHLYRGEYAPLAFEDFELQFYNSAPRAARSGRLNDNSTVVLLTHANGTRLLMMGDCELAAENQLLSGEFSGMEPVDILKAGHHGMATSSGWEFLSQMSPRAVVATGIIGMYAAGDGGSLAYKTRQLGAALYGPQLRQDMLTLAFGEELREYTFYVGAEENEEAPRFSLEAGWVDLDPIYRLRVNEDLLAVEEEILRK